MRRPLAILLAGLAAAAACTSAPAPAPGLGPDRTVTLPTADGERTAIVHHPAGAAAGAPLVLVLHGAGGTGAEVRADLGWDAVADRDRFVVAYPDGKGNTWNGGGCCGDARRNGVDDVGYLHALKAQLATQDGIDPHRVSAVGFSNGAIMAYAWACERPGDLAGIGPVAGAVLVDCPMPGPVTVVAVHGTADDRVPFDGGPGPSGATFPTVDASLAPFLASDGCAQAPATTTAAPATVATWTCASRRGVVRVVVDGGGHGWPGAGPGAGRGKGPLDATAFLWDRLRDAPPS